jgi:hypothetical protein
MYWYSVVIVDDETAACAAPGSASVPAVAAERRTKLRREIELSSKFPSCPSLFEAIVD